MAKKNQTGISLVLAILIMGAVSAVAVTLSVLIINEVGTTKGINNAMKAFYAAESAIEQSTWIVREARRTGMTIDATVALLNQTNSGTLEDTSATWARQATGENQSITVSLRKDESVFLDLYNPQPAGNPPYKIQCEYEENGAGNNLEITWSGWSTTDGFCPETTKVFGVQCDGATFLNLDTPLTCGNPTSYRVQLRAFDGPATNLTLSIFDLNQTPIEIPSQVKIIANGTYTAGSSLSATQALRADVQWTLPVSGLFSYVLFSEQNLQKED